ncbi:MAG: hypothetical protein Q7K40_00540 [bacterium]|nr:hypothetical protein [bacterium]
MIKPIISFVVIILSATFVFFYVVPEYQLNKELRDKVVSLSKTIESSDEIKGLISETKKSLGTVSPEDLDRFKVFLPEEVDPIRFANNIQQIGRAHRIILSGIKIDGPSNMAQNKGVSLDTQKGSASQGVVNTFSLGAKIDQAVGANTKTSTGVTPSGRKFATTKATFTFVSTFESFQLFLSDIEKSLGLIEVTALSFTPMSDDGSSKKSKTAAPSMYQYTMAIETYSLK